MNGHFVEAFGLTIKNISKLHFAQLIRRNYRKKHCYDLVLNISQSLIVTYFYLCANKFQGTKILLKPVRQGWEQVPRKAP